ncbi:hypothetical protein KGF54_004820 [Candida jiufengensis]|uniref:uncharacterized protein n=1 Tax=Candida jiufengensis TaxID=497108 RepID=UPI002223F1CF|nr:uncharacterized protein KGF54_004820 [Candida jiufengensis]KAI5951745.1 hypothetical protein KGF54_004820 [Candida jiufengensis]
MSNETTLNWSFSFYEESYDETYEETTQESDTAQLDQSNETKHKDILNDIKEIQSTSSNQYNPFIIAKLNSLKRSSSKYKSKVYNKKMVVSSRDFNQELIDASKNHKKDLLWINLTKWINRKGNPSNSLISTFANKVNCELNDVAFIKEQQNNWYTLGVVQKEI